MRWFVCWRFVCWKLNCTFFILLELDVSQMANIVQYLTALCVICGSVGGHDDRLEQFRKYGYLNITLLRVIK